MPSIGNASETSQAQSIAAVTAWEAIAPGIYSVQLTATSASGLTNTKTVTLSIGSTNDQFIGVGESTETDTSGGMTPNQTGPVSVDMGGAGETDTGNSVTPQITAPQSGISSQDKVWTRQEMPTCLDGKKWTFCAPGNQP